MRPRLLAFRPRTALNHMHTTCAILSLTRSLLTSSTPPTSPSSRAPSTRLSRGWMHHRKPRRRSMRESKRSWRASPTLSCRSSTALQVVLLAVSPVLLEVHQVVSLAQARTVLLWRRSIKAAACSLVRLLFLLRILRHFHRIARYECVMNQ